MEQQLPLPNPKIGILPKYSWPAKQYGASSRYVGLLHTKWGRKNHASWSCMIHYTNMPWGEECCMCASGKPLEHVTVR